ncbi:hypothetical protein ACFLS5_01555 [Candidatus Bipolaricaulota bacterium]
MKSIGWTVLLLVVAVSLGAWAQCGCEVQEEPSCYLTFRSNETIEFSLVAPIDYFMCQETTISPGIFGWRAEAWDGTVVRSVLYPGEPRGRLMTMEWDLHDESGYLVPPGSYRIVVMTTDGDVSYPVRIVDTCRSCCGCFYWRPTSFARDVPCRIPYGELYLSLGVGETRSHVGLTVNLTITVECAAP